MKFGGITEFVSILLQLKYSAWWSCLYPSNDDMTTGETPACVETQWPHSGAFVGLGHSESTLNTISTAETGGHPGSMKT